jgi:hypothetical protein
MSMNDSDLVERLHALAEGFEMPPASLNDDIWRGRRRVRRNRRLVTGTAAAAIAVVLGVTAAVGGQDLLRSEEPGPVDAPTVVETPAVVVDAVPVWYDAAGLHHGDVVEQTPVEILQPERTGPEPGTVYPSEGSLALVRKGALYSDPRSGDVWFHPWGGEPRIVGHDSDAGPGGDPQGDIAVWFEGSDAMIGSSGELVVYDTAAGREISRTRQAHGVATQSGDHYPEGNKFLQVSAERVVWSSGPKTYAFEVPTGTTSTFEEGSASYLIDAQGDVEVWGEREPWVPLLRVPGRAEQRLVGLGIHLKVSTTGNYLLAVEETDARHGAAILDTRTGELWPVPRNAYPWIAWSYGDLALVNVDAEVEDQANDVLLACDAARRTCEVLDAERPFLLPTN